MNYWRLNLSVCTWCDVHFNANYIASAQSHANAIKYTHHRVDTWLVLFVYPFCYKSPSYSVELMLLNWHKSLTGSGRAGRISMRVDLFLAECGQWARDSRPPDRSLAGLSEDWSLLWGCLPRHMECSNSDPVQTGNCQPSASVCLAYLAI